METQATATEDEWDADDGRPDWMKFKDPETEKYHRMWEHEREMRERYEDMIQPLYELPFASLSEIPFEIDRLKDEIAYHKADARKWANAVDAKNAELANAALQIADLHAEIKRLDVALKIKTEEHDCCAEDVKTIREATCTWWEGDDGGPWATQCNELFNIENEGPEANGMRFCCFCGKKLVEVEADTDEIEKWKDENL